MNRRHYFSAVLMVLTFTQCVDRPEVIEPVPKARHLLNQSRYADAIAVLQSHIELHPTDGEALVLLSSALVGAEGLNLINAFSALKGPFFDKPLMNLDAKSEIKAMDTDFLQSSPAVSAAPQESHLRQFERYVLAFLTAFQKGALVAFQLPFVKVEHRSRILRAIATLERVSEKDEHYVQAHLYEAILNLLQFTNILRDSVRSTVWKSDSPMTIFCATDLANLSGNFARMGKYLSEAIDSLDAARSHGALGGAKLRKIRDSLAQGEYFFARNRDHLSMAELAQGILKDEICPR